MGVGQGAGAGRAALDRAGNGEACVGRAVLGPAMGRPTRSGWHRGRAGSAVLGRRLG
jgi:hypothetical protein